MGTTKSSRRETSAGLSRVSQFETDGNIAGLIRELSNPVGRGRYSIVRADAARALGRLGDPRAVPYLASLADDDVDIVRADAYEALGRIGTDGCTALLLEALRDPEARARCAAVEALGKLKAHEAIEPLRYLLHHDVDRFVRLYAAEALAGMNDRDVVDAIHRSSPRSRGERVDSSAGERSRSSHRTLNAHRSGGSGLAFAQLLLFVTESAADRCSGRFR